MMKDSVMLFRSFTTLFCLFAGAAQAGGWVEGSPTYVQKTDYDGNNSLFVAMEQPVAVVAGGGECSSRFGVVIHDNNPSAKAAMSFAITALTAGKKFRCYVNTAECARVTGASLPTYPVCSHYPTLKK